MKHREPAFYGIRTVSTPNHVALTVWFPRPNFTRILGGVLIGAVFIILLLIAAILRNGPSVGFLLLGPLLVGFTVCLDFVYQLNISIISSIKRLIQSPLAHEKPKKKMVI